MVETHGRASLQKSNKKSNYSGIKLSIPLILSLSKDKADVKTGSWFDKLTMSVLKTLAQNT
jgi:hypothetical protein